MSKQPWSQRTANENRAAAEFVFSDVHQLLTDIRSGLRMLVKYPTLSIVAVLTLGLGIGLSTTVFCVVNGGLFKGLPFPAAGRRVALAATTPSQQHPRQPSTDT